jgi:hypothetical protein
MRPFAIDAIALLFVFVGVHQFAQANEVKAKIEDRKGEAKALTEEAKGNKVRGTMERAKGKTKAAGERI